MCCRIVALDLCFSGKFYSLVASFKTFYKYYKISITSHSSFAPSLAMRKSNNVIKSYMLSLFDTISRKKYKLQKL